jgi:hypothetical protein
MSDPRGTARIPIQQSREPGRNYDMYMGQNPPRIFVDGIAGITGGAAISLLDFFVTTDVRPDSDPNYGMKETREVQFRVAVPTAQLLEGIANLVTLLQANLDAIAAGARENAEAVALQAQRLKGMNAR